MYRCTRCDKKSEYKSTLSCSRCLDDTGPRLRESSNEVVREVVDTAADFAVTSAVSEFISDLLSGD